VVTITSPSNPIIRGEPAEFTATVKDEDSSASFLLKWAEFKSENDRCDGIKAADWSSSKTVKTLASSEAYPFSTQSLDVVCLCAQATDHNGATGQACLPIVPINSKPIAQIVDISGAASNQTRPLCTQVHLSAEGSTFPVGDNLQFKWDIQYSGSDSTVQLAACTGVDSDKTDQHRCFYAAEAGIYTVTLSIIDTVVSSGSDASTITKSEPTTFIVPVNEDTPPCLQRTDPDMYAQRILLARNSGLGGTYQSRTFRVLSVADDCEPYPLPAGSTNKPAQFVWSVYDSTQASPSWSYQTNNSDSFTVSQAMFPNARPGDTIEVRVEVRDTKVQKNYPLVHACASDNVDICCGSSACSGINDCIRWTTWTVQFQP
jgi:hypothetical protein